MPLGKEVKAKQGIMCRYENKTLGLWSNTPPKCENCPIRRDQKAQASERRGDQKRGDGGKRRRHCRFQIAAKTTGLAGTKELRGRGEEGEGKREKRRGRGEGEREGRTRERMNERREREREGEREDTYGG